MALLERREKQRKQSEIEYPRGGHVADPPEDCPWRKKFEPGGAYWTETCFCGYYCDEQCGQFRAHVHKHKMARAEAFKREKREEK
jgi:hypothetical protein